MKRRQELLLYRFKSLCVWIMRAGHCRGFGIQSPWAYSFVRYVVNEHYPYYAYAEMDANTATGQPTRRKFLRFVFRLTNFIQPAFLVALDYEQPQVTLELYAAACHAKRRVGAVDTTLARLTPATLAGYRRQHGQPLMIVVNGRAFAPSMTAADAEHARRQIGHIVAYMTPGDVLVVDGIYHRLRPCDLWTIVRHDAGVAASFDLYSCGVAFVDAKRYKQHYKVNF